MTGAHAPGVRIQTGRNHIAAIKHEALGRASTTNLLGIPNAVLHNHGYNEAQWGGYQDTF